MKKIYFFLFLFAISGISAIHAQSLQPGECGIRFTYDAAGNLTQREFICNNTGVVMYRSANNKDNKKDTSVVAGSPNNKVAADDIVTVSSIMPNPTTGRFTVLLSRPLKSQNVMLLDANGRIIQNRKESGTTLTFNISAQPPGIYFIKVGFRNTYTFKVIKQ